MCEITSRSSGSAEIWYFIWKLHFRTKLCSKPSSLSGVSSLRLQLHCLSHIRLLSLFSHSPWRFLLSFRGSSRKASTFFILYYKLMPTHVPTSPNFINDGGFFSLLSQPKNYTTHTTHKDRTCEHNVNMKFNRNSLLKEWREGGARMKMNGKRAMRFFGQEREARYCWGHGQTSRAKQKRCEVYVCMAESKIERSEGERNWSKRWKCEIYGPVRSNFFLILHSSFFPLLSFFGFPFLRRTLVRESERKRYENLIMREGGEAKKPIWEVDCWLVLSWTR